LTYLSLLVIISNTTGMAHLKSTCFPNGFMTWQLASTP